MNLQMIPGPRVKPFFASMMTTMATTAIAMPIPTATFVFVDQLLLFDGWISDLAAGTTFPALASATSLSILFFNSGSGCASLLARTSPVMFAASAFAFEVGELLAEAEFPHKAINSVATSVAQVRFLNTISPLVGVTIRLFLERYALCGITRRPLEVLPFPSPETRMQRTQPKGRSLRTLKWARSRANLPVKLRAVL